MELELKHDKCGVFKDQDTSRKRETHTVGRLVALMISITVEIAFKLYDEEEKRKRNRETIKQGAHGTFNQ